MYLLLILGKNVNTQLHIQTIIRRPLIVLGIELYFVTVVSGNNVSKMMIFTPKRIELEQQDCAHMEAPFMGF